MIDYTVDERQILNKFEKEREKYEVFLAGVISFFEKNLECKKYVHSIRSRTKDAEHLIKKIRRKNDKEKIVTVDNLFEKITDLTGVRVRSEERRVGKECRAGRAEDQEEKR